MKYTRYLLRGNYFQYQHFSPGNVIIKAVYESFIMVLSCYIVSFCCLLIPVTITTDLLRNLYCIEIKFSRRMRQNAFVRSMHVKRIYIAVNRAAGILF